MLSKSWVLAATLIVGVPLTAAASVYVSSRAEAQASQSSLAKTVYTNVSLFDAVSDELQHNMAIVVEGERILEVAPMASLSEHLSADAKEVDGSSWYAIPGLVEAHTHLATAPNQERAEFLLNRQLYGGITSVRDMAGDARFLANLKRASVTHEIAAPDIEFAALMGGPDFFSDPRTVSSGRGGTPGELPWMQAVTENSDFVQAVAVARGTNASAIKTYSHISGSTLQKLVAQAKSQGLPVWSHAQIGPASSLEVARAGVQSMSHACDILSVAIPEEVNDRARAGELGGGRPFVDVDANDPRIDLVFAEMRKYGTMLDATLRLHRVMDEVFARRAQQANSQGGEAQRRGPPFRPGSVPAARAACDSAMAIEITRRAFVAGVGIITGTDGHANGDDPFPALHEEIDILHRQVGMPMAEVLKAATINGAVSMAKADEIGTIEEGKLANIVFLTENPLDGAASLRAIVMTVKRGRPYLRTDFSLRGPG